MNVHFILRPRILACFLMFVLTLMDTTPAISQESLATDFEDIETRVRFFAKVENSQQLWCHESLTVLSPLENSLWSFRHQLLGRTTEKKQDSIVAPIWGGLLGATVGFFGGGFLGAGISGQRGYDSIGNSVIGAIIGETLVMPLGVHYGNKRKGSFVLDLLTSLTIVGGGLLTIKELDADESFLLFIPVLQIGGTVAVERVTAHHN